VHEREPSDAFIVWDATRIDRWVAERGRNVTSIWVVGWPSPALRRDDILLTWRILPA